MQNVTEKTLAVTQGKKVLISNGLRDTHRDDHSQHNCCDPKKNKHKPPLQNTSRNFSCMEQPKSVNHRKYVKQDNMHRKKADILLLLLLVQN